MSGTPPPIFLCDRHHTTDREGSLNRTGPETKLFSFDKLVADLDELADPSVLRIRWRQIVDKNYALSEVIEQFYIDSAVHPNIERAQSNEARSFYKEVELLAKAIRSIDVWIDFDELVKLPEYDLVRRRARRVRNVVESGWHALAAELSILVEFPIDYIGRPFIDPHPESLFWSLPTDHQQVVRETNGFSAELGRKRFLGCGHYDLNLDLDAWNANETWRYAWKSQVLPYLFFAYDQWGSQVAYERSQDGALVDGRVHEVDGYSMRVIRSHNSFAEYWDTLRNTAMHPRRHVHAPERYLYSRQGPMNPAFLYSMAMPITSEVTGTGEVSVVPAAAAMIRAGQLYEPTGASPWNDMADPTSGGPAGS